MSDEYVFEGGYPTPETVAQVYDDVDLNRAVHAYRFFFPTVSMAAAYKGNAEAGFPANKAIVLMHASPEVQVFTPNSDTPYAGGSLDLSDGPFVIDLPPGAFMGAVNDVNQRYVMDLGLPGPDQGRGGKHLIVPPGWDGETPDGYYIGQATTNRVILMLRAMPSEGAGPDAVLAMMKTVGIHPLEPAADWTEMVWKQEMPAGADLTLLRWEDNISYWRELHEVIDLEPPYEPYRDAYGDLAALGIVKGKPFAPDERMTGILERAALVGNAQMRVQSFADRRPDRVVWEGRRWEWAVLRPENGTFDAESHVDLEAREKWFFQAQIESPAMFRRSAGAGSLYWLGARDSTGAFLDGARSYRLSVPRPVPAKLFWSITVYDTETRSEIRTDQDLAALRSTVELTAERLGDGNTAELHFGPEHPEGAEGRWIKTIPGKGWFVYFRIYGPEQPAFDNSWQLPDFEPQT
jgi:hypothetical protein